MIPKQNAALSQPPTVKATKKWTKTIFEIYQSKTSKIIKVS